jgi:exodeoxyribonuclease VII small subunit
MSPAKPKITTKLPDLEGLSYEKALAELETIVASLEGNKLSLEGAMALFERGKELTQHCVDLLDKAELRVKKLSGDTLVDVVVEE